VERGGWRRRATAREEEEGTVAVEREWEWRKVDVL
jgi:hypothetical protein